MKLKKPTNEIKKNPQMKFKKTHKWNLKKPTNEI